MQQSVRGGVLAAPISSGLASFGRLTTQMWPSLSVTITGMPWRIHLCGSGLGQNGSTLYMGTGASLSFDACVCAFTRGATPADTKANTPAAMADARAIRFQIFMAVPLCHSNDTDRPMARSLFS